MQRARASVMRRARSSVVWGLAIFCALQAGLTLAVEFCLPELRDPEFGIRYKILAGRMKSAPQRPLTVVLLGSSRTTMGFCGGRLESALSEALGRPVVVFNFGLTGAGPILEQLSLRRLLGHGIRPDLVLLEVLPPLLAGQVSPERDRIARERLWFGELSLFQKYGAAQETLQRQWWDSWPLPWYRHRLAVLGRFAPMFIPLTARLDWLYTLDASGFVAPLRTRDRGASSTSTALALAEYAPYFKDFR